MHRERGRAARRGRRDSRPDEEADRPPLFSGLFLRAPDERDLRFGVGVAGGADILVPPRPPHQPLHIDILLALHLHDEGGARPHRARMNALRQVGMERGEREADFAHEWL